MNNHTAHPVSIPRSHHLSMRFQGREYEIFVSFPVGPPPPSGFPVLYMLDGNAVFGTVTEAVRAQSRFPERTGVYPAVIVAIGYSTDAPFHPSRHYDFTMPVPRAELPPSPDGTDWPEQGGAMAFLSFIEDELMPMIAAQYSIDPSRGSLIGHSLGGLFVLFALFTRPYLFQRFAAGSPSIYWNENVLQEKERQFVQLLQHNKPIDLLLTAGELERTHESLVNVKTKALAERLSALGNDRLSVEYREFEDEQHISVLPVFISKAIRFAMKNPL